HGVVRGGVDPHRPLERVLPRDALVHLEQVAVALRDHPAAETRDRVAEVQIYAVAAGPHAAPFVAHFLGASRRAVRRRQVPVGRVPPVAIIVPLLLRTLVRRPRVAIFLWYPASP